MRTAGWIDRIEVDEATVSVVAVVATPGPPVTVLVRANGSVLGPAVADDDGRAWRSVLDRSRVPVGSVVFDALAVGGDGLVERLDPVRWAVASLAGVDRPPASHGSAPGPVGWVDHPVDGAEEREGVLEVAGWVSPPGEVDRIEVSVDGGPPDPARLLCSPRSDLVDHLGDAGAAMAGFWHLVDVAAAGLSGEVTVAVDAVGPQRRVPLARRCVRIGPIATEASDAERRWVAALAARADAAAARCVPGEGLGLVVVTHDLGLGGAQLWLQEILRPLLWQEDMRCTVLAPIDGPLRAELEAAGARVHLMGHLPTTGAAYESTVHELALLVGSDEANVVLVNTAAPRIGVDLAARCGLPSVWAVHDHYTEQAFWRCAFGRGAVDAHVRERGRIALDQAAAVCFVAEATRAVFAPDVDDERAVVVDYGIGLGALDAERRAVDRPAWRAAHGFDPDAVVVLCTGTVDARKSQAVLVAAFARVADRHPTARLVLVGAAGQAYERGTVDLAHALGVGARVRVVPATPDVTPWYVAADAFALASDLESLPRSLIEAMAHGLPLVATEVGGVAELVADGETGILCPARDVAALAAALDRLLTMPAGDRAALGARAQAAVWPARDVHDYVDGVARLLRGLAKDPSASPRELLGTAARPA
ncbi:MAG: glycosyltransferase family 4 protein [Acidimicrobiales bacterium]